VAHLGAAQGRPRHPHWTLCGPTGTDGAGILWDLCGGCCTVVSWYVDSDLGCGGAVWLGHGPLVVSFASRVGALLAFWVSRYMLRDFIQQRFGKLVEPINEGLAKDGTFYLLTLRLVPVFPFWMINLLMGLTTLGARKFYVVSQIGMLVGTAVYVNAGTQLAAIDTAGDVRSPGLIASLALLGIFPLIAKAIVGAAQTRKVYAHWPRPSRFDRNLVVIGTGAGGLVSAYIAAAVKAKVTLIEGHKMGGDCLNSGCVPSKALIRSAKAIKQLSEAHKLGPRQAHGECYGPRFFRTDNPSCSRRDGGVYPDMFEVVRAPAGTWVRRVLRSGCDNAPGGERAALGSEPGVRAAGVSQKGNSSL